eukprot:361905-Chlamydomonas_euryale.AAC.4
MPSRSAGRDALTIAARPCPALCSYTSCKTLPGHTQRDALGNPGSVCRSVESSSTPQHLGTIWACVCGRFKP